VAEPQLFSHSGWTFRWQPAQKKPESLLILVHGRTGDENSMWTLAHNLPSNYSIVAPRGPYPALEGGFSWRNDSSKRDSLSSSIDLRPAAEGLMEFIDTWTVSEGINIRQYDLVGFSQGAAVVYILTLLYPDRILKVAALAGFFPQGAEALLVPSHLAGKQIFISHGRKDNMVQVEEARRAVKLLRETGAQVTYCESDAAHKVSKECLQAMGKFLG
jgi:phospholipase/carboxylesterase